MARGKTLTYLLNALRAECRMSLNAAHNNQVRDTQVLALQTKQDWYWGDFAWPHLRVDRFIQLQAGQRFYDMPEDLDIERISNITVRYGQAWLPVEPGIDMIHYAAIDSYQGMRCDPVRRWRITEDEQIEVWPIPATNYDSATFETQLKVVGIRTLKPLVAENDRADLDDQLLVKSCAADYLASIGAKDAQLKLDQVNRMYTKLRGQLMPRNRFFIGVGRRANHVRPQRIPVAVYPKS